MHMRKYDLYYFAGFFDGEGAIMLSRKSYVRLTVAVSQNTVDVMNWHKKVFGGHVYSYVPSSRPDTTIFQWKVNGEEAVAFLTLIEPMLIIKKAQARDAILGWTCRHSPEIVDPLIQKWKDYHAERRRRITESKANRI